MTLQCAVLLKYRSDVVWWGFNLVVTRMCVCVGMVHEINDTLFYVRTSPMYVWNVECETNIACRPRYAGY